MSLSHASFVGLVVRNSRRVSKRLVHVSSAMNGRTFSSRGVLDGCLELSFRLAWHLK